MKKFKLKNVLITDTSSRSYDKAYISRLYGYIKDLGIRYNIFERRFNRDNMKRFELSKDLNFYTTKDSQENIVSLIFPNAWMIAVNDEREQEEQMIKHSKDENGKPVVTISRDEYCQMLGRLERLDHIEKGKVVVMTEKKLSEMKEQIKSTRRENDSLLKVINDLSRSLGNLDEHHLRCREDNIPNKEYNLRSGYDKYRDDLGFRNLVTYLRTLISTGKVTFGDIILGLDILRDMMSSISSSYRYEVRE